MNEWELECPACGLGLDLGTWAAEYPNQKARFKHGDRPAKEVSIAAVVMEHMYEEHASFGTSEEWKNVCPVCNHTYPYELWQGDVGEHMVTHTWKEFCKAVALAQLGGMI